MYENKSTTDNRLSVKPPAKRGRRSKLQKALPISRNVYLLPSLKMQDMEPARAGANDHLAIGRIGLRC